MDGCQTQNAWFGWVMVNTTVKDRVPCRQGIPWTSATTINATNDSATYKHDNVYWIYLAKDRVQSLASAKTQYFYF